MDSSSSMVCGLLMLVILLLVFMIAYQMGKYSNQRKKFAVGCAPYLNKDDGSGRCRTWCGDDADCVSESQCTDSYDGAGYPLRRCIAKQTGEATLGAMQASQAARAMLFEPTECKA